MTSIAEILKRAAAKAARPIPFHMWESGAIPTITPDQHNFHISTITGAAPAPVNCVVPLSGLSPLSMQLGGSCGPWAAFGSVWATMPPAVRVMLSPRAGYVWSRKKLYGTATNAIWQADNGTTLPVCMWVLNNLGLPTVAAWPLSGDINEVPSSNAGISASAWTATYYATPTISDIQAAIQRGIPVANYVHLSSDYYYPETLPDGSCEIDTPTAASANGSGHFNNIVAIDYARVCQDGTTGAVKFRNPGWEGWGDADGGAWASITGWINQRGDPNSRFALVSNVTAPAPAPETKMKVHISIQNGNVVWESTGAVVVRINGVKNNLSGSMPIDGSSGFTITGYDAAGNIPTDGSGYAYVPAPVTTTPAPTPPATPGTRTIKSFTFDAAKGILTINYSDSTSETKP